jgi:hypothetical protein
MTVINNENATETGAIATDLNTKINDINAKIITCPRWRHGSTCSLEMVF